MRAAWMLLITAGAWLGLASPAQAFGGPSVWDFCKAAAEDILGERDGYGNSYATPLVKVPGGVGVAIGGFPMMLVGFAAGAVPGVAAAPFGKGKEAFGYVAGSVAAAGAITGAVLFGGPFWLVDLAIPGGPCGPRSCADTNPAPSQPPLESAPGSSR
jgi:hypothetical protein